MAFRNRRRKCRGEGWGGISSRSSHSLNSGYDAALVESVTPVVEAKPEPESVEAKPEPESVEAKPEPEPESTTPVIGVSSVDDIIDVVKYVKKKVGYV